MAILVVEDDPDLADLLSYILRRAGHDVVVAGDGESALELWWKNNPELVILDIGLPGSNGWDVCKVIRSQSSTPIMILSAAGSDEDIVRGLDLGAEDYVTKPFSPSVLQARINRLLNRNRAHMPAHESGTSLVLGDLKLNAALRSLTCREQSVSLTRLEYQIMSELALHIGQVVPHSDLIRRVWGYKNEASSKLVKAHILNIRRKLEKVGSSTSIRIVPGDGYLLSKDLT